jgi:hypothetical protein
VKPLQQVFFSKATRLLVTFAVILGFATVLDNQIASAAGEPSVTWTTSSGSTFSGTASIEATASAISGYVKKWCITKDGVALTTNLAVYSGSQGLSNNANFSSSTGCWTSVSPSSSRSLLNGKLSFDTTAWVDGSHTYQITVTDSSDRTATSTVLTINNVNTGPSVLWTTTSGSTFSGTAAIEATAAPADTGSAYIKKWCITKDGVALTTNLAVYSGSQGLSNNANFSSSTGCWTSVSPSSSRSLLNGKLSFDTTAWVDGSHTYQITVTDSSDRTATSTVLTINNVNTGPSVSWTTSSGTTFSGTAKIEATAAPASTGSAYVKKWCITKNGAALTTNLAVYSNSAGLSSNGEFNSSTGCWTSLYPNSGYSLLTGKLSFDTTAWVDGSHTYQITVTDSSDRTATSTVLTIKTNNPRPTIALVGITQGATVSGVLVLSLNVTMPSGVSGLSIKSYCYKFNGSSCEGSSSGLSVDTSDLRNGNHTVLVSVVDSAERTITLPEISFTTNNPGAAISGVSRSFEKPSWSQKSVTASLSISTERASGVLVKYGTASKKLSRSKWLDSDGGYIRGLKPNTKYFFSVQATGLNGRSSTSVFSMRSPKIPPRPRITSSRCVANQYMNLYTGFKYYRYFYRYTWSNGNTTYSTTKVDDSYPC